MPDVRTRVVVVSPNGQHILERQLSGACPLPREGEMLWIDGARGRAWYQVRSAALGLSESASDLVVHVVAEAVRRPSSAETDSPPEMRQVGQSEVVVLEDGGSRTLDDGLMVALDRVSRGAARVTLTETGAVTTNTAQKYLSTGERVVLNATRSRRVWAATLKQALYVGNTQILIERFDLA